MNFSINQWNEITEFLNGYVLDRVIFQGKNVVGVNSRGESFVLATPAGSYWAAVDGKAFEAVSDLLREAKDEVKRRGSYAEEVKIAVLKEVFEQNIKLFNKAYKN